jgi:hypothetical protein
MDETSCGEARAITYIENTSSETSNASTRYFAALQLEMKIGARPPFASERLGERS